MLGEMKTKFKLVIISSIVLVSIITITGGTTCVFDVEDRNWLGSENGCGPSITYAIQNYFGIFWSIIPQAFAACLLDTDWPQKPCLDTPPYTIEEKKEAWAPYYDYKGAEWMEMKKVEMEQILESGDLEDWKRESRANYNVWYYNTLFGEYPVPFYEEKSLEDNLKENRLPIGQGVYMNFTFFLILLSGGIGGIIFVIKRKRK